eukprot:UN31570
MEYDPNEWMNNKNISEFEESSIVDEALGGLATIAEAVSEENKKNVNLLMGKIETLVKGNNWQSKTAGITAIGQCLEVLETSNVELCTILNVINPLIQHKHPRVRHACCNCIGLICSDFTRGRKQHWNQIIKCL